MQRQREREVDGETCSPDVSQGLGFGFRVEGYRNSSLRSCDSPKTSPSSAALSRCAAWRLVRRAAQGEPPLKDLLSSEHVMCAASIKPVHQYMLILYTVLLW